jgi:hypothetical protein
MAIPATTFVAIVMTSVVAITQYSSTCTPVNAATYWGTLLPRYSNNVWVLPPATTTTATTTTTGRWLTQSTIEAIRGGSSATGKLDEYIQIYVLM